jgi:hypothetical protein
MGKTVPSYRWALEDEIGDWKGFRRALESDEDREAYDCMMDMCRNNATASGYACNPVIFEPMIMSILLAQQKLNREFKNNLNELLWREICKTEKPKEKG